MDVPVVRQRQGQQIGEVLMVQFPDRIGDVPVLLGEVPHRGRDRAGVGCLRVKKLQNTVETLHLQHIDGDVDGSVA